MGDCRSRHEFKNWSRTLEFTPNRFCKPRTEARLVEIVKEARARKGCVRTQGAGHSFSQLLPTDDTLVSLDDMDDGILHVNGTQVTCSAGIRLKELIDQLARLAQPLALRNMGSVTEQSIAGAISTGTHGTGVGYGCMSTQVTGVKMVTGKGEVVVYDSTTPDEMKAACLSLGALGILTEVTLDCVPHFKVAYDAYCATFDDAMAHLDDLVDNNERMLIWWLVPFLSRDHVVIVTKNLLNTPAAGVLAGAQNNYVQPFGIRHTPLGKHVDALWGELFRQPFSARGKFTRIWHMEGDYDDMLTLPLLPYYHTECEYAVPRAEAVSALSAFRDVVEENDFDLKLPVEVRFMAKDDLWLSPGNKGPVCYIGASTEDNTAEVFSRFEPLMRARGGRPHWGKHFTLLRDDIKQMYGQGYDDFVSLRDQLDPDRVFSNSLLNEIFGS